MGKQVRLWLHGPDSIPEVAARNLCSGCGVCAAAQPDSIRMVDATTGQRRPLVAHVNNQPLDTTFALSTCPGAHLRHADGNYDEQLSDVERIWGPVLEVWEGYAADPEIRWSGSSGGVITALALHQLTSGASGAVLHTGARTSDPLMAGTLLSRDRAGLLSGTGSRYQPASPGEGLHLLLQESQPCVVIGKPCDIAGARMLGQKRPDLDQKMSLLISIFCAGTPGQKGTADALSELGVDPSRVAEIRYRGNGWPGQFTVTTDSGDTATLSYQESWGAILQRHRQWRCRICPDHSGEFADLAVGDPWYRPIEPGDPGRSLVLVRTEAGRRALAAAMSDGAVVMEQVSGDIVGRSQPHLMTARGAVWGRMAAMRLMGMATPRYRRLRTFPTWLRRLTLREKAQSTLGTIRRIRRRGLRRPETVEAKRGTS